VKAARKRPPQKIVESKTSPTPPTNKQNKTVKRVSLIILFSSLPFFLSLVVSGRAPAFLAWSASCRCCCCVLLLAHLLCCGLIASLLPHASPPIPSPSYNLLSLAYCYVQFPSCCRRRRHMHVCACVRARVVFHGRVLVLLVNLVGLLMSLAVPPPPLPSRYLLSMYVYIKRLKNRLKIDSPFLSFHMSSLSFPSPPSSSYFPFPSYPPTQTTNALFLVPRHRIHTHTHTHTHTQLLLSSSSRQ